MKKKARVLALYLPQFHPIPENDKFWGKGFTEWTNVVRAKPLFRGHYQPRIPADLGFYDLRMTEVREAQADMARKAGVEGFCYWHYWFGNGRMLLERPFQEVLESGKPDFPFCLGWANHSWTTATWVKGSNKLEKEVIADQLYLGKDDYVAHFNYCLPAFKDSRYVLVDGKPFFAIYDPFASMEISRFMDIWQELAIKNGFPGIHFVGLNNTYSSVSDLINMGFSAVNNRKMWAAEAACSGSHLMRTIQAKISKYLNIPVSRFKYSDIINNMYTDEEYLENCYPTILSGYDRSPRAGHKAVIYYDTTPELFRKQIKMALECIKNRPDEYKILILKSWNEWGESNYVEPDLKYGHAFLNVLKEEIKEDINT